MKNPISKVQADIHYPLLILSFDFPLTLLWVGFEFPKIGNWVNWEGNDEKIGEQYGQNEQNEQRRTE